MKEFESRINLNIGLDKLSLKVCEEYNLGNFISNKLIEIGYEDYNYVLTTDKGQFVLKVFSNDRTDNNAYELAERASIAYEQGVSCPRIHKTKDDNTLLVLSLSNTEYRLLVMDYINGKDFFSLKELPNEKELENIARELAKLNNIEYKPNFIYDKWAIVNFNQEYEKNINIVDEEDKPLIDKAFNVFKSCDFTKLKYGFVHGDIIETNVIRDEQGRLFL